MKVYTPRYVFLCGCIGAYRVGKVERAFNRKNAVYARECIEFDVSGARRSALRRRSCPPVFVVERIHADNPTGRRVSRTASGRVQRHPRAECNLDIIIEVAC
jgi:hypothetical protein